MDLALTSYFRQGFRIGTHVLALVPSTNRKWIKKIKKTHFLSDFAHIGLFEFLVEHVFLVALVLTANYAKVYHELHHYIPLIETIRKYVWIISFGV